MTGISSFLRRRTILSTFSFSSTFRRLAMEPSGIIHSTVISSADGTCPSILLISVKLMIWLSTTRCSFFSATKVPMPCLRTTKPSSASSSMALRTVMRLTSKCWLNSASVISLSPAFNLPSVICCLIFSDSCW